MSELIVREITHRDRPASYGNVDLGVKENQSRGGAKATVMRDIPGTQFRVCLTFLSDTFHNRAYILEKSKTSKNQMEVMVRQDDGQVVRLSVAWLDEVFGDTKEHAAKLAKALPAGYSADAHDPMDHDSENPGLPITVALDAGKNPDTGAPKEKPQPGPKAQAAAAAKAAKTGKAKPSATVPAPAAQAMPEGDAEGGEDAGDEVVFRSLNDFLALPMRVQMVALDAGLPIELLQDITTSDSTSLENDVKNKAFSKLSE